ncbi:MarR family transcriptional regulator [Neolewinella aurantiaca]|uniref:MarR family transcriptional regulator n=1 Tax=Neolewinella aurantiaca TaxID=2602767 RepID=A0A5C7FVX1_9BACT|nr:MarR family transcriptional regulator [Neolewinella aurantiaca]TXF90524.1 MarR family transcriptional regulator [Neolewinella aurantiaca]
MTTPHQNLIFLTNRVGRQLARLMLERIEFEEFMPQGPHMGLLSDIVLEEGQRQQDLATSTIKDKGTVARSLKQLEAAGFIRREVDLNDRRQKRIYLTEKGRRLWDYSRSQSEQVMTCAQKDISDEDLKVCASVLGKMYSNLHKQLSLPHQSIDQ